MTMGRCFFFALIVVYVVEGILASRPESDISDVLNEFRQRIESLEAREAVKDAIIATMQSEMLIKNAKLADMDSEISDLKLRMDLMESSHHLKEARLQDKIEQLEMTMEQSIKDSKTEQQSEDTTTVMNRQSSKVNVIKRHKSSARFVPETDVAFYTTHKSGEIHHLGVNQALQFQLELTDNGNAYNNNTGAFVAPVDGTYVFHATVMAIDTSDHFRAHFDVDGTTYSVFFVTSRDQSSQMLVINLKSGQTVTIRNDYSDTGYFGAHHSTFSGFLLYQHEPTGAIVG